MNEQTNFPTQHVDDFIDNACYQHEDTSLHYASFFLNLMRMDAVHQMAYRPIMNELGIRLFCEHEGITYRVTGASRLGDIWLTRDFNRELGHEKRVDVTTCQNWRRQP